MSDFIPNPANYVMKGNKPSVLQSTRQMPATTAKEYIKGLGMAELETIALEVLSEALQTVCPRREPELAMKIANATLDRTRGKPAQAVTVDTTLRQITVNAQVQFVRVQPALENSTVTIENDNILNPSK